MIVVAIVAILGAIAYPSYLDSVHQRQARRRAHGLTGTAAEQQERYMTQNNTHLRLPPMPTKTPCRSVKIYSRAMAASSAYKLGAEACSGTQTIDHCVRVSPPLSTQTLPSPGSNSPAQGEKLLRQQHQRLPEVGVAMRHFSPIPGSQLHRTQGFTLIELM